MATQSASILLEEAAFGTGLNRALKMCPEVWSCRRFFRQPEGAEDAAAEVFLKLHTVLDQKDEEHPFRHGCARWPGAIASTNCAGGRG